jgi:WD40 repeat protein
MLHPGGVGSVAFAPDRDVFATAGRDRTVRVWDTLVGTQIIEMIGHTNEVTDVTFSPDGAVLASAGGDNTIRLWNAHTGEPIGPPLTGHEDWVTSVAFSHDGSSMVSGSLDGTIRLWDRILEADAACELAEAFVSRELLAAVVPTGYVPSACDLTSR